MYTYALASTWLLTNHLRSSRFHTPNLTLSQLFSSSIKFPLAPYQTSRKSPIMPHSLLHPHTQSAQTHRLLPWLLRCDRSIVDSSRGQRAHVPVAPLLPPLTPHPSLLCLLGSCLPAAPEPLHSLPPTNTFQILTRIKTAFSEFPW